MIFYHKKKILHLAWQWFKFDNEPNNALVSSIIEGYNYDIFISYRRKDNKHDSWVTEFVNNLKGELESTFKEEISVYFDINPHDGLLETHDVDASLKEKLKCLIFIPIISRTYCDPKSFAWEHEFKAFIDQESHGKPGLKIKLSNGNVASRVLPVRIHDLEAEDVKLFEETTGGVIRTLDFVFKTASGVNRPLKSTEDHPADNMNKTYYQDQINKVALAVKEIIQGIKAALVLTEKDENHEQDTLIIPKSEDILLKARRAVIPKRKTLFITLGIPAILIAAVLLFYPSIFNRDKFEKIRDADGKISIAVMPFENLTGDTTLNWFQRGISSLIINGLGNSPELDVCDDQTMFEIIGSLNHVNTAGISPSLSKEVAKKANASTYISGSYQGREETYWILVNLVNAENGSIIGTRKVQGNIKSAAYFAMADSLCNELKNYLEIRALGDIADYEFRDVYPQSAEAYRYFIEGMNQVLIQNYESGIQSLEKALAIDSTFTFAAFYLAYAYNIQSKFEESVLWAKEAYLHRERVPKKYQLWIELWDKCYYGKNREDIVRNCDLLAESGINTRLFWYDLGVTYYSILKENIKAVNAFEKVMEINLERGDYLQILPFWDNFLYALHNIGDYDREREVANIGLALLPDRSNRFLYHLAVCALSQGKKSEADDILLKYKAKHKELGTAEAILEVNYGMMYEQAHILDQAENHYRRAYKMEPGKLNYPIKLAEFLIVNDINVDEGMDLLQISMGKLTKYYEGLTYLLGWGLYKQGKYDEAVEILERAWEKSTGFNTDFYFYLQEAKKALAGQSNI